jgi:hypothetical protein
MRLVQLTIWILLTMHLTYAQELNTKLSHQIKSIVKDMAKYKRIDSEAVGFAGTRTKQYDRFIKLTHIATTEELVLLMDHKSPVVRGYSFWALAKLNYSDLEKIFKAHKNDTEYVDELDGCIGGKIPLIDFMTWVVTPNILDVNCKKLQIK